MNTRIALMVLVIFIFPLLSGGCSRNAEIGSPACEELKTTTDPVRKAELERRCPRSGKAIKPSPEKNW